MPDDQFDPLLTPRVNRESDIRVVQRAIAAVATSVVAVNLVLLITAAIDRSWGAFGIALIFGPASNAVIALVALCLTPKLRRVSGDAPIEPYMLASILLPIAGAGVDFLLIGLLPLHGC